MKVKTLVAMLVSGMLAVSFSYAVPPPPRAQLMADDATSSQPPAANDTTSNPGAMEGGNAGNPMATPSDTNPAATGTGDSSSTGTSSDEESQDQATGDSGDY